MDINLMPSNQQMMYPDNTQRNYIPASLLAQFPELENINWDQLPNQQDDGGVSGGEMYGDDDDEDGYLSDMPSDQGHGQPQMGYPVQVQGMTGQQQNY